MSTKGGKQHVLEGRVGKQKKINKSQQRGAVNAGKAAARVAKIDSEKKKSIKNGSSNGKKAARPEKSEKQATTLSKAGAKGAREVGDPKKKNNGNGRTVNEKQKKRSISPPKEERLTELDEKTKQAQLDELDNLFKNAKKNKNSKKDTLQQASRPKREDDSFWKDSRGTQSTRRYTEDGLPIYTAEELGLATDRDGGDTPLCPFDCDCCY